MIHARHQNKLVTYIFIGRTGINNLTEITKPNQTEISVVRFSFGNRSLTDRQNMKFISVNQEFWFGSVFS